MIHNSVQQEKFSKSIKGIPVKQIEKNSTQGKKY